ncbi:MAG: hypothetical protein LBN25_00435, partial [Christensenellaceae bacterium]|nr:hypothetical protein [Christensenellaceae bacterium]
ESESVAAEENDGQYESAEQITAGENTAAVIIPEAAEVAAVAPEKPQIIPAAPQVRLKNYVPPPKNNYNNKTAKKKKKH